ncbi:unnamed protein product [Cyclocybe aegerita]|uniref:PH domain-containing protein n=1 Tax=Cyclocybe aegerita TaxID=1973307 RepID=A0A8S0WY40_CYCAE|nr:unnamed protein product [Cyclocybe aegerita]
MATRKSPLRDRLLSNSPDPIKSSILRESGMGWSSSTTGSISSSGSNGSITSPLRISKRDSPARPKGPVVARRTSSSYRHVHNNNLVSKSPFKSQIPTSATPSSRPVPITFPTRKVSGEKRPRPASMHEQAETENDRPFALKRDCKQSKTFQGLIEKEPVTKSPFKLRQSAQASETKPVLIPPAPPLHDTTPVVSTPPSSSHIQPPPVTTAKGPSPARSALVSRRLHGPRLSGGGRRERRKTVTFHERCDVLEFDRDEDEDMEEVFESADEEELPDEHHDEHDHPEDGDDPFNDFLHGNNDRDEVMEDDTSYDSVRLSDAGVNPSVPSLLSDPDASITGIVEEMFFSTNAANLLADASMTSGMSTPPRHHDIPTDLETEDGVPFGRSHHIERFLQHNQHPSHVHQPPHFSPTGSPPHHSSPHHHSPSSYPYAFNLPTAASPYGPPATPPRRSPGVQHSTPPLGRSTHAERVLKAREEQREEEEEIDDVERLPVSPSPMKKARESTTLEEGLIPKLDLMNSGNQRDPESNTSANLSIDSFAPRLQDESILSDLSRQSNQSSKEDSMDPSNLSVGSSEVSISHLTGERESNEMLTSLEAPASTEDSPKTTFREPSPPALTELQAAMLRRTASPASNNGSPLLTLRSHEQGLVKTSSRERFSREEVQRRLYNHRQQSSPSLRSSVDGPNPAITINRADELNLQPSNLFDKEKDRSSVLTTQTDFSTETAIVETVEKRVLGMATLSPPRADDKEFGLLTPNSGLQLDFGSRFGVGGLGILIGDDSKSIHIQDTIEAPAPTPTRPASIESGSSEVRVGNVDVDMEMKSALDRLMEDVAGAGAPPDDSMLTDEYDDSFERSHTQSQDDHEPFRSSSRPRILERAATDSVLLQQNEAGGVTSRTVSGSSSIMLPPPPVPPKDNIKSREQLILEKRREARRLEEEAEEEFYSRGRDQRSLGVGRPSRRRSMSTGDAEVLSRSAKKRGDILLDVASEAVGKDDPLSDSIERELQKLSDVPKRSKYLVREREGTIYATSSVERISHMAGAGDVDAGRAWKMVRRPSDMNEYAKQIKEYRAQDKGKAYGKVFVRVKSITGLHLPLPREPTAMTCTLNNGIHFVTTPECQLSQECRIEQEFELIEHSKLEFTLTLKVRRDPHIIAQYKAVSAPAPVVAVPPPPPLAVQVAKSSGKRSFWSSSPKKSSKEKIVVQPPPPPPQPQPVHRLPENLARHLKPDGTLARAFVSFKDIASHCDTRVFETRYPLIGQRVELGGKYSTMEVGEITLQVFRLPPLPGLPQDQLPLSLEECQRGLRHINWHKVTYFEGILTQNGGDCSTLHRRPYRIIGSNLIAFSDITKKATATIDLKKAINVRDDQEDARSPVGARSSRYDDDEGLYSLKHSFRLIFPHNQEIVFSADNDEGKARWLEVLRALVGHIPPHPLWGELLWQRQEEISKRMTAAQQIIPQSIPVHSSRHPQPR